ncbi:MAG: mandelate racemase [Alphaproteobacteria bacterium]|nr:mandelate racemase [Alphaproteobacteria bacterium]
MRIVEVRERTASIAAPITNAFIDFTGMTCSVVAVITDVVRGGKPVIGYGFSSNGRYSAGGLLRERFLPRLRAARPESLLDDAGANLDPFRIWATLMANEKPGGHGERSTAVGTVDMAVWDALAKVEDKPLYRVLAERFGKGEPDARVWVYAAGGYYHPGKDLRALQDEMKSYRDRGYRVVKMKIGGASRVAPGARLRRDERAKQESLAEDLRRVEAVLAVVGDGKCLCVDANGRFDLDTATAYAKALQPFGLFWYEEAGDPLDFALQAELRRRYDGPMATGENLFSMADARNLVRFGGLNPERDFLQFDCALSYGLVEYLRTLEMLAAHGWSSRRVVPHGGHQMSLAIAAGLHLGGNESYPDVFRPFCGFADGIAVEDGYVRLPDAPGIGFETKRELYAVMKELAS